MEVEYKKDLRHNYMVIAECEDSNIEPYCIKLLEHQSIDGLLPMEQKQMDNKSLYYYDITAKQSMINLLDKTVLSCDKVKLLFARILDTMERAYEYLLPEDDFILSPEYIYLDVTSNIPFLCFFSGYHKSIKEQMNLLIEYLMNKVDYNDKNAVLLVYQLYAASREEGFTFDHLLEVLKKQIQTPLENRNHRKDIICPENMLGGDYQREEDKKKENKPPTPLKINQENHAKKDNNMSVMMEKIEGEEEISCYPMKSYLYTGFCITGGIFITILGFSTGLLYNTFGNRVDYSKLFAMILIIFCVDGYLLKKVWDKKNKITKMIAKQEYIDPRQQNFNKGATIAREAITEDREKVSFHRCNDKVSPLNKDQHSAPTQPKINVQTMRSDITYSDEINKQEDNPTCLLNESFEKTGLVLKPLQEANYQTIHLSDFPFFIGKLKENVDYCLEKDVVSRFHAKITKEQEQYFITDLNSKNGTFVNQEALQTYQKREIKMGDEVAFANIKYLFMLQNR